MEWKLFQHTEKKNPAVTLLCVPAFSDTRAGRVTSELCANYKLMSKPLMLWMESELFLCTGVALGERVPTLAKKLYL